MADHLGVDGELLPVGRPGRVEAEIRQAPDVLARCPHDEDSAAISLRAERDEIAGWRKGRLRVGDRRVLGQVNRVLPSDALQIDVRVAALGADVKKARAVWRKSRKIFLTRLKCEL